MTIDERKLAVFGELAARLSRPLADRSAILWQARLDESRFREIEAQCIGWLEREPESWEAFVTAFARCRRALEGVSGAVVAASSLPDSQPTDNEPTDNEPTDSATDIEQMMKTVPRAPPSLDTPHTLEPPTERHVPWSPTKRSADRK